jgi:hypothetical protein
MKLNILSNKERLIVPWLLIIIYFALPSRHVMYDSIRFAQAIKAGNLRAYPFWHPSHLLYELTMYGLYSLMQDIGLHLTLFQLCTVQGILSCLLVVYLAIRLLVMHGIPSRWAALAFSMWMGSYVVWHCATLPDLSRNLLAILLLIIAFLVVTQSQSGSLKARTFLAGLLLGLAGLFHILAVFAAPSFLYFLSKHAEKGKRIRTFFPAIIASMATVLSFYIFATIFLGQIRDIHDFLRWFSAPGGSEWWQSDFMRATLDFLMTSIRALFGTVTYEPLKRALFSAGAVHGVTLLFGLLGAATLACWGVITVTEIIHPSRPLTLPGQAMCIWFVSYLPFAVLFDKWDVRVLLYLSVPIPFLIAECASRRNVRWHQIAGLITVLVLFVVNGFTIMRKENNPGTQRAFELLASMDALSQDAGDLFLVSMGTDALYAQYFGKRRALPLRTAETDFSTLRSELTDVRKKGKRVYVETELLDMIIKGKHPYSGILAELIGIESSSTRGPEERGFKFIDPAATR